MRSFILLLACCASPLAAADFSSDVKPLLEAECLQCHNASNALGGIRLDSRAEAAKVIQAGKPDQSPLYSALAPDDDRVMPPSGALPADKRALIRDWIAAGAAWPDGVTLAVGAKESSDLDTQELVAKLHARIEAKGPTPAGEAYEETIPGTVVSFKMAPIPGGKFTMGSPASEGKRKADEGPRHEVAIAPFWMGVTEVTWDMYRLFMFSQLSGDAEKGDEVIDAVSRPTKPYVEMSFGMGIEGYPAISMTQHAAEKFTEWLSARTGHFYRLPTEAEWEYACRAGTTTAYSFGDDPAQLKDYGWSVDNSNFTYQKVGQKKPNPWGLHDMHGNVMEWTLDQYTPKGYAEGAANNPWVKPTTLYPRVARGGSWFDDADRLRCAARTGSDAQWKMQDPQQPKSIWYHTDAQFLGLRVVRPVETPSADAMYEYWNSGRENQ
jgi:formylglycine-generating enzyme required for sulfatase activity